MAHKPPIRLSGDRDPWDRQEGESELMYSRFRTYLELGRTRTLTSAAGILTATGDSSKLTGAYIRSLSMSYLWTQRTGAYDREQDRLERERLIEQRRDMIRRHLKTANDLTAKAREALTKVKTDKLSPLDIVRFFRLATVIESNALGLPGETVAVTGAAGGPVLLDDMTGLTDADRRARMAEVAREVAARAGTSLDDPDAEDD